MQLFNKKNKYSHLKGRKEEDIAAKFLKKQGLKLITSNYYSRFGEIDLIMQDNRDNENTLVFIEVKSRKDDAKVSAKESVTKSKQEKIIKTANSYLINYENIPNCRFDVITLTYKKSTVPKSSNKVYNIEWIESAFM